MENSDWGSDSSTDDEAFRELAIRCIIQFRAGHGRKGDFMSSTWEDRPWLSEPSFRRLAASNTLSNPHCAHNDCKGARGGGRNKFDPAAAAEEEEATPKVSNNTHFAWLCHRAPLLEEHPPTQETVQIQWVWKSRVWRRGWLVRCTCCLCNAGNNSWHRSGSVLDAAAAATDARWSHHQPSSHRRRQ